MSDIFEDFTTNRGPASVDTGTGKQLSQLVRSLREVEQRSAMRRTTIKALKQEKHKLSVENIPP